MKKIIDLSPETIKKLQKLADRDSRKLKPYIEKVLDEYANQKANWPDYKTIQEAIKGLKK